MYLCNDNCSIKGLENYEDLLSHKLEGWMPIFLSPQSPSVWPLSPLGHHRASVITRISSIQPNQADCFEFKGMIPSNQQCTEPGNKYKVVTSIIINQIQSSPMPISSCGSRGVYMCTFKREDQPSKQCSLSSFQAKHNWINTLNCKIWSFCHFSH